MILLKLNLPHMPLNGTRKSISLKMSIRELQRWDLLAFMSEKMLEVLVLEDLRLA